MRRTILMDVDGVLADFYQPAAAAHGVPYLALDGAWPRGTWDIASQLGITPEQFWHKIDTEDFWRGLRPYPGAQEFLAYCASVLNGHIVLCTKCGPSPVFGSARIAWADEHFPGYPVVIVRGASKALMARSDAVLLDDHPETIRDFNDAGGLGVLVERPWNEPPCGLNRTTSYSRVDYPATLAAAVRAVRYDEDTLPAPSIAGGQR
jgi:5'(3')-deoxyribonucleotidase